MRNYYYRTNEAINRTKKIRCGTSQATGVFCTHNLIYLLTQIPDNNGTRPRFYHHTHSMKLSNLTKKRKFLSNFATKSEIKSRGNTLVKLKFQFFIYIFNN